MNLELKKELNRIFDSVENRDYYSVVKEFFELCAISIRNSVDHGKDHDKLEKRYMDIASTYTKAQLENFSQGLAILGGEITKATTGDADFCDWAGEIYMASGTSNSKAGQFFTPYCVSRVAAEVNLDRELIRSKLQDDPNYVFTIHEPTCGAGGMVVAVVDVLHSMNINYAWNCFVDCGDIDPRCVHMTYLTLSLLGVPAVVRLGNALSLEYSQAWYTPAYLFAWPHFEVKMRNNKGKTDAQKISKNPEPIEVVEEPKKEPEPASIMNKNGQYSLF